MGLTKEFRSRLDVTCFQLSKKGNCPVQAASIRNNPCEKADLYCTRVLEGALNKGARPD